jgi:putative oxidoreductase
VYPDVPPRRNFALRLTGVFDNHFGEFTHHIAAASSILLVSRPLPRSCAMKVATVITRILLGLVFFASGIVSLLKLGKMGGMPTDATTFLTLMVVHNYTTFIALIMLIGGLLLLVGRFVPIGLVLLGPILVNILIFHISFKVPGIVTGLVCTALEIFLIWVYRISFRGLFVAAPELS